MDSLKILIRIPNHLGDTIMARPAVKAFISEITDTKTFLLLPEWAKPVYSDLDNTILIPLKSNYLHGPIGLIHQSRLLRKYRFDTGVVLTPSFSSALALFLAGVKTRYGYEGEGRTGLLNHPIKPLRENNVHRMNRYFNLLEKPIDRSLNLSRPDYPLDKRTKEQATKLLAEYGIDLSDRFVAIAPQAVAESRRWGSENYNALSGRLIDKYHVKIILIGTAGEFSAGQEIAGDNNHIINLCGKTDIASAAGILGHARLFIGNDSGLAHLSAAVDIPLVVLSGADNPPETSPVSDKKTVIIKDDLDCISCVRNICPLKGEAYMKCMKIISVEEVFTVATEYLRN